MSTRNVKQIEADIAKLKAELADVKDSEAMRTSAVHILKNLGWTREKGQWVCPSKPNMNFIDFDDKPKAIRVGDFVRHDGYQSLYLLVRSVQGNSVVVSRILKKQHFGVVCEPTSYSRPLMGLTKVSYNEINL